MASSHVDVFYKFIFYLLAFITDEEVRVQKGKYETALNFFFSFDLIAFG